MEIEISKTALTEGATYKARPLFGGTQIMIRFANGYGLSVVRHDMSYGGSSGMWEAAPVKYIGSDFYDWEFCGSAKSLSGYEHDDVRGWLSATDVDEIAQRVAQL